MGSDVSREIPPGEERDVGSFNRPLLELVAERCRGLWREGEAASPNSNSTPSPSSMTARVSRRSADLTPSSGPISMSTWMPIPSRSPVPVAARVSTSELESGPGSVSGTGVGTGTVAVPAADMFVSLTPASTDSARQQRRADLIERWKAREF